jgi:hypothetical protein
MPTFRKKPVEVEAIQWTGENAEEIKACCGEKASPPWRHSPRTFLIETAEGHLGAMPGDWIIKGIAGEFYPCKPEIFEESYELVT